MIAPADGTIVAIEEVMENEILHKKCLQISIFMSIFNVHANWFPVNGTCGERGKEEGVRMNTAGTFSRESFP